VRNRFLQDRTAAEIDRQVAKILRGLGNPKPPLHLEDARALLDLDLQYYSSSDDGALREFIHNLRVAGKQIVLRPTILLDAIKRFDLHALYLPDRKRILLDEAQPEIKQRWNQAHEIIHSIVPWHEELSLGDNRSTLSQGCYEQLEAEANYGAGRLLFLLDLFDQFARETKPQIEAIKQLAVIFGNTITNTLWRYVERSEYILFEIVSPHPYYLPPTFDPTNPCKYFIRSRSFAKMFPDTNERDLFQIISAYCDRRRAGPVGSGEIRLHDANRDAHIFACESFSNSYEMLTLGVYQSKYSPSVKVPHTMRVA
jgi:IrrE N-terminal-like domain